MMKFKVGDCVYMNPRYYDTRSIDTTIGYITANTEEWDSKVHIIDWLDGELYTRY